MEMEMGRLDSIPRSVRFTAQQQSLLLLSSDFRGFLVLPHGVYQAICPPRWDLSEPSLLSGLKHSCLRPEQQKTPSRICRHGQRRSGVPMSFVTLPPLAIIMIHIIQYNPSNSPDYSSPFGVALP